MILLDTNALIWIDAEHLRVRRLLSREQRLYASPASVLELQFLHETNRIRLKHGGIRWVMEDDRWMLDEPPAGAWFLRAVDVGWTRDPFDRLIAAHALLRQWRLATSDLGIIAHFGPDNCIEL